MTADTMVMTCEAAPVQYEGTVAGRAFYFRARWSSWTFGVAGDGGTIADAVSVAMGAEAGFRRAGDVPGGEYEASYMRCGEAADIIQRCCAEFREEAPDDSTP